MNWAMEGLIITGFPLAADEDYDEAWLHSGEKWLKNAFLQDHYLRDQFAISKQHK